MTDETQGTDAGANDADRKAREAYHEESLKRLARIEEKLGVPHGYYQSLRDNGSDWEFAIKLVVLLEAALGLVIASKLQNDAMRDHCDRLNLVGRTGKLALAEALGVLRPAEVKAFAALAETRNRFAHKVSNINSDLPTFAAQLPEGERDGACKRLLMIPQSVENELAFLWKGEGNILLFRFAMWRAGALLLDALATQDAKAEDERERLWKQERQHQWTLRDLYAIEGESQSGSSRLGTAAS